MLSGGPTLLGIGHRGIHHVLGPVSVIQEIQVICTFHLGLYLNPLGPHEPKTNDLSIKGLAHAHAL